MQRGDLWHPRFDLRSLGAAAVVAEGSFNITDWLLACFGVKQLHPLSGLALLSKRMQLFPLPAIHERQLL